MIAMIPTLLFVIDPITIGAMKPPQLAQVSVIPMRIPE